MRKAKISFLLFCLTTSLAAQIEITGIQTTWSDAINEWRIFTADETVEGELEKRWKDGTDWDFVIDSLDGSIKMKWSNDPTEWEARDNINPVATAKTKWTNNYKEWRITNNDVTINLRPKWGNSLDEWEIKDSGYGSLSLNTYFEGDYTDWEVYDELSTDVPDNMKMLAIYIVLFVCYR